MLSIASSFTIVRDIGLNFLSTILSYPCSYLVPTVKKFQTEFRLTLFKTY